MNPLRGRGPRFAPDLAAELRLQLPPGELRNEHFVFEGADGDGQNVARNGERVAGFDEAPVARHMKGDHIAIAIDIGLGSGAATVWT